MLDTLAVVAILIAVAIAVVLVLAATKPDTFSVRRETTVSAPPEKIFPLINDFRSWAHGRLMKARDPAMKRTSAGPSGRPGAVYAWEGNKNVGSGPRWKSSRRLRRTRSHQARLLRAVQGNNIAEFTMLPRGDETHLTWAMHGPAAVMSEADAMVISLRQDGR